MLAAYGYEIQNSSPTRVTSTSATCLDHVISCFPIETRTIKISISDHYALESDIPVLLKGKKKAREPQLLCRDLRNIKGPKALNFLFLLDQKLKSMHEASDPEKYLSEVVNCIMFCVNKCAPMKVFKKRRQQTWATNRVKNLINQRDKAFEKWIKEPSVMNRNQLKSLRNKVTDEIRKAKKDFSYKLLGENPSASRIYKTLKYQKSATQPTNKIPGVEALNDYFTQIGPTLSSKLPNLVYLSTIPRVTKTMVFNNTTAEEITKILHNLKNKKSTGYDGISNEILKCCSPIIEPYIADVFNKCLEKSIFPQSLKIARVIPLFKKGDRSNPENYRPISLLSSLSKVFEKVICKRMTKFFMKNESFTANQYGFRDKRSCTHAIGEVLDYIRNEMDKRNAGNACFIDLKKAFDTLDHNILLQKLEKYGFRGKVLSLLSNYLANRQQYVEHDGIRSSTKTLNTGVPQGSVLGPFLFLIYINDLPSVCKNSKISLFADDTTVYNLGRYSEKEITEDIQKMRSWFDMNKLTLNVEKCESISFGRAQTVSEEAFGEKISCKRSCKYLGVLIDDKLNFKDHVNYVTKN